MNETTHCLFQEPWWLDAVAPGAWGAVEIERDGRIVARLPYLLKRKFGVNEISRPPLTPTLGPWLATSSAKYGKQLKHEKDLMEALIAKLPIYDHFNQSFHYSITNWLPFYWKGFTQTTRYTYVLDTLDNEELLWSNLLVNIRTEIRKARKILKVNRGLDIDKFLNINRMTFSRQGKKLPYSEDLVNRIFFACRERDAVEIFYATDSENRIHGAAFIVWDHRSAYYLMSGSDPNLRNSGVMSLLLWEAILFSANVTKQFDFEGSIIESVERFFRAFGAKQHPYFNVTRMNRRASVLYHGRQLVKHSLGK